MPVRKTTVPRTDRERYRHILAAFKAELAALYRDPRAARQAFTSSLAEMSPEAAARALESGPHRFGQLRLGADLLRRAEAGRWAELYARWQVEKGTRLYARLGKTRWTSRELKPIPARALLLRPPQAGDRPRARVRERRPRPQQPLRPSRQRHARAGLSGPGERVRARAAKARQSMRRFLLEGADGEEVAA